MRRTACRPKSTRSPRAVLASSCAPALKAISATGQRLALRRRNVSAAPGVEPSTAARLFERVSADGASAAGFTRWGLQPGARADLLVLDPHDPALRGLPVDHLLDGVVFNSPARPFARLMVAGRWRAPQDEGIAERFESAMQALWAPLPPRG
jgi:formimidoylglutamate deiminase